MRSAGVSPASYGGVSPPVRTLHAPNSKKSLALANSCTRGSDASVVLRTANNEWSRQTEGSKNRKKIDMNVTRKTSLALFIGVALFSFLSAQAQYVATGDDGITASPKVRQALSAQAQPASIAGKTEMSCPQCKDQLVPSSDVTLRGAHRSPVLVAKHLCGACTTRMQVTGTGKAATTTATHSCSAGSKASCCGS